MAVSVTLMRNQKKKRKAAISISVKGEALECEHTDEEVRKLKGLKHRCIAFLGRIEARTNSLPVSSGSLI